MADIILEIYQELSLNIPAHRISTGITNDEIKKIFRFFEPEYNTNINIDINSLIETKDKSLILEKINVLEKNNSQPNSNTKFMYNGECLGKRLLWSESDSKQLERRLKEEWGNYSFETAEKAKKTYESIFLKINHNDDKSDDLNENYSQNEDKDSIDQTIQKNFENKFEFEITTTTKKVKNINPTSMNIEFDSNTKENDYITPEKN